MSHHLPWARCAVPVLLAAVCCGAVATSSGPPDSWGPFRNKRIVTPSGKRYVVVRKKGLGITFELCARRAGQPPLESVADSGYPGLWNLGGKDKDVSRDPKDRLLAKGTYKQMPMQVQITDGLDGFLLFDKYGNLGYGEVVTWIDGRGKVVFEHSLEDLFGGSPKGTTATVSSLWWSRAIWLDARAQSIIVVTSLGELREVKVADGAISEPSAERLIGWAMHGDVGGRATALEVIAEGDVARCEKALPLVSGTFLDRSEPLSLRLRAGWILARVGNEPGVERLYLETVRGGDEVADADMRFAVRHLGDVMGDRALAVLRDLMRGKASKVWGDAYQAFAAIGESAVPTLLEMVEEQDQSADYRGGAVHALAEIGSAAAVPTLRRATRCGNNYVEGAARVALKRTFWKVVDRAWARIPKDLAREHIDLQTGAPLVEQLGAFDKEWALKLLNDRIDKTDLRFGRYLERVRDGVDS
ncbi:MAG: HEAT repeat domain-containing protein [Planctomycetota bacterium]